MFYLNENSETFVYKAENSPELLQLNQLTKDDMGMATPAITGNRLLIRTSARIYCIAEN